MVAKGKAEGMVAMTPKEYSQLLDDFGIIKNAYRMSAKHFMDMEAAYKRIGSLLSSLYVQKPQESDPAIKSFPGYKLEEKENERIVTPTVTRLNLGNVIIMEEWKKYVDKDLVLDLANISYIDSSGICDLLSLFREYDNKGKKLELTNVNKKITELLQVTKLHIVFKVRERQKTRL